MSEHRTNTSLIWTPDWTDDDQSKARIVYFRTTFNIEEIPENTVIRISADTRYKLYVNGIFIQEGPQPAVSDNEWYVDEANLSSVLRPGENVIAAAVLRLPYGTDRIPLLNTNTACLMAEEKDQDSKWLAAAEWKCSVSRTTDLKETMQDSEIISYTETVHADSLYSGWNEAGYDDSSWQNAIIIPAKEYFPCRAPFCQAPRNIPYMKTEECRFERVINVQEGNQDFNHTFQFLIENDVAAKIPSNTTVMIDLKAQETVCGYLLYEFVGGAGARICTICMDYDSNGKEHSHQASEYCVAGHGTADHPEGYEPFMVQRFGAVCLRIETAEAPLFVHKLTYRSSMYPLMNRIFFEVSDPAYQNLYDKSFKVLRGSMQDHYLDGPYHRHLLRAMNARSELLFTYAISLDDHLGKETMEAFRCSQRRDGLLNSVIPAVIRDVIPGDSIFYILMVHDHMMYFADKDLIRRQLPSVDLILEFFRSHLNDDGLVENLYGARNKYDYHPFDDGTDCFKEIDEYPLIMDSLLYLYGLQKASELADYVGRIGVAEEFRQRAETMKRTIRAHCVGEYREQMMIMDGAGWEHYSLHAQVFSILTGVVPPEFGRNMLEQAMQNEEMSACSSVFLFYLFRALEQCGMYERVGSFWNQLRNTDAEHALRDGEMMKEEDKEQGGAALMCYEMPSAVLGVRPVAPGFSRVRIHPYIGALDKAQGDVISPAGMIHVEWKRSSKGYDLNYEVPEGMPVETS